MRDNATGASIPVLYVAIRNGAAHDLLKRRAERLVEPDDRVCNAAAVVKAAAIRGGVTHDCAIVDGRRATPETATYAAAHIAGDYAVLDEPAITAPQATTVAASGVALCPLLS